MCGPRTSSKAWLTWFRQVTIVVLCLVAALVVVAACSSFIWMVRRKKRAEMEVGKRSSQFATGLTTR